MEMSTFTFLSWAVMSAEGRSCLVEAEDREVEGCMGFSAVCGSVVCFAGGVGTAFEVVGLATGVVGLNTLPDLMTSAHIAVA